MQYTCHTQTHDRKDTCTSFRVAAHDVAAKNKETRHGVLFKVVILTVCQSKLAVAQLLRVLVVVVLRLRNHHVCALRFQSGARVGRKVLHEEAQHSPNSSPILFGGLLEVHQHAAQGGDVRHGDVRELVLGKGGSHLPDGGGNLAIDKRGGRQKKVRFRRSRLQGAFRSVHVTEGTLYQRYTEAAEVAPRLLGTNVRTTSKIVVLEELLEQE